MAFHWLLLPFHPDISTPPIGARHSIVFYNGQDDIAKPQFHCIVCSIMVLRNRGVPNYHRPLGGTIMKLKSFITASIFALWAAPAFSEELKFASFVPPQHTVTSSLIDKLAADIAAGTGGSLTLRNYPGGKLGAGPVEQYVRVLQGVADMGWGLPGYTSSQFEKTMIAELPGAIDVETPGYAALWAAYEAHLKGEFPGIKALALWTSEPNIMIMRDKIIHTPADLAGLKIRVAGATAADVASALGATPVQMPINQVYNALQTGLIDGVFTGSSTLNDFKLDEVANSFTIGAPLGRLSFFAVMNGAKYNGLSNAEKAAIDAASGIELSKSAEDAWNATGEAGVTRARGEAKNTFVDLSAGEVAAFEAAVSNVANNYVASVGGEAAMAAMRGK
ncbi:MAG: TRAP-type C4-dicarboxylate transport system substrate-binding protein [Paracoccaceae bacterium]|jgi:TRAP-type C4-dicarboxylate transport system substrate-binding protein